MRNLINCLKAYTFMCFALYLYFLNSIFSKAELKGEIVIAELDISDFDSIHAFC